METQDGIQEIIEQNKNKKENFVEENKKGNFLLCASKKKIHSSDTFPGQPTLAQISWTEITAKAFREFVVKGAENIARRIWLRTWKRQKEGSTDDEKLGDGEQDAKRPEIDLHSSEEEREGENYSERFIMKSVQAQKIPISIIRGKMESGNFPSHVQTGNKWSSWITLNPSITCDALFRAKQNFN